MEEISRLQKNLPLLRTTANWSVQEFSELLGVTRQTINNLEKTDPIKMSKIQYLAIRSLFSYEVENGNEMLGQLLYYLVDHPEKITDKERKMILQQAKILSNAVKGGSTKKEVDESWKAVLAMVGAAVVPIAIEAGVAWLEVLMSNKAVKK